MRSRERGGTAGRVARSSCWRFARSPTGRRVILSPRTSDSSSYSPKRSLAPSDVALVEALVEEPDESLCMRRRKDHNDFAAWDYLGLALCGTHLDTRDDLAEAIEAFQIARGLTRPRPTPVLVDRLRFLLAQLDRHAEQPGRLRPAIDALSHPSS